jgi:hypothetical protein
MVAPADRVTVVSLTIAPSNSGLYPPMDGLSTCSTHLVYELLEHKSNRLNRPNSATNELCSMKTSHS